MEVEKNQTRNNVLLFATQLGFAIFSIYARGIREINAPNAFRSGRDFAFHDFNPVSLRCCAVRPRNLTQ